NPRFREWSAAAQPEGYPDKIVWRFGGNDVSVIRSVERGHADFLFHLLSITGIHELETQYPTQLHVDTVSATIYMFLNTREPPFDDVRVRQALNYAVDRDKWRRRAGAYDFLQPACQVLPPNVSGYHPYCPYTLHPDSAGTWRAVDLAKARRLITSSG